VNDKINFSDISREDILKAFQKYDELAAKKELNPNRGKKDYILFWASKEYPHKYIVGIAYGIKYNQETLDYTLYNSTGSHNASAQWCIEKNGFELYADTKFKQYLEKTYTNQITINTYYSDLKKAIRIFQNIEELKDKKLSEIFQYVLDEKLKFEIYDKAQKNLGYDDAQLYKNFKNIIRVYLRAINESEGSGQMNTISEEQENLFYKLARKHNLLSREPHMSKGRIYYQIYPKNTPKKEGTGGCHYEFGVDKNDKTLKLFLHVETGVHKQKELKNILEYKTALIADVTGFDDSEIESIFDGMVQKYEDKINNFYTQEYKENNGDNTMLQTQPLNQILYGPPGTGKTYHTINKALEIIYNCNENDILQYIIKDINISQEIKDIQDEREKIKKVFEYYKEQGQIEFVTFHQSYGYEEFVEGIKAQTITDEETNKKIITYDVKPGVFKRFCEQAKNIKSQQKAIYDFDKNTNIWKISLGDSLNSEEDYLFNYCIENNKILLGFGDGLDFSDCKNRQEIANKLNDEEKYSYPPTAINMLKNKIKKDDIVLVSYGNTKLRAIAKVIEEYKYLDDENLKNYVQSRGVEWLLIPEEPFLYEKVLKKQFSQMSIYDVKSNVKIEVLRNLLTKNSTNKDYTQNYILIIDEINRGNISKIFGELITLVEESKRIGANEEIRVKLPYSGDSEGAFGVPSNLYIIGTMNTADRSIAPIDTALRRRFVFEEMVPRPSLLNNKSDGIDLKKLLEAINTRIEYLYDRDHTLGHAYLIDVKNLDDLIFAFKNKMIPLLAEYFYEDWENIDLVLNSNGFIIENKENKSYLSKQIEDKIRNKTAYKVSDDIGWTKEHFIKIYSDENAFSHNTLEDQSLNG